MKVVATLGNAMLLASVSVTFVQVAVPQEVACHPVYPSTRVYTSWEFNDCGQREGWEVPPLLGGKVWGGSLWLTLAPQVVDSPQVGSPHPPDALFSRQMFAPKLPGAIVSPPGLGIAVTKNTKVRLRLLNQSAETDGLVWWRLADNPKADAGVIRFSMRPQQREWQEVIAHLDAVHGTIGQLRIQPYVHGLKGDIFIDRISVTDGPPRQLPPRPDVCSKRVVPQVSLPGIKQAQFQDAFRVLDECIFLDIPVAGFEYPVMGPGGAYGENWWQLDTSLNQAGTQWVNRSFSENIIRGLAGVQSQNPDGRIDLWGGAPGAGNQAM